MKVIVAKNAGFCSGVRRALNITNKTLDNRQGIVYSYGPLVHNSDLVGKLEEKGLVTVDSILAAKDGEIIVRSHGVGKNKLNEIKEAGLKLVDCTCPYVKLVHKKVEKYSQQGYEIVIIGDANHPEVKGIAGWSKSKPFIINSLEDVENMPTLKDVCLVSQTTNTREKFNTLVKAVENKGENVLVFNTICRATNDRQTAAKELAKEVDAMVVIGGYHSSNTKKLAEISKEYCKHVFHIERIADLPLQKVSKFNTIGVTAGASTPDWIIKEAIEVMDKLNNNEMLEAIEKSFTKIHKGEIIKGRVIFVTDDEVMVNINYKSDGIINREELSSDSSLSPKELFQEGDEIDVYVLRVDDGEGNVVLSTKRVEEVKNWDEVEEIFENQEIVEVKVLRVVKGGLIALINNINGFIPASHISVDFITDLEQFKDKTLKVRVIDFNRQKRRVILSRKVVEEEELEKKREELWNSLEVGSLVEGTVQRLTDFGAFVDLGGVDGLIHISDLSWYRVKHPSEVVQAGDKVEVKVLDFSQERNRISLGLKQTVKEPWVVFLENANVGDVVEGKVVNLLDFGAFIRLKEGVDGLLHVSQISREHVDKPSDVLNIGDQVTVEIIDINEEDRRISLSKRALEEEEEPKEVEEKNDQPKEDESDDFSNEEEYVTIEDVINSK